MIKHLFLKTMVCFSGCLLSSASLQKLFCGVCSALKCSFEEFVREKVVFPSYSSAIFPSPAQYWCFWTVVLKTLESPLDWKEVKPVNPKGNQPWIFIGRTDVEAETPILWPPDVKTWLIRKDPDAGKIEGRRRRGWQRPPGGEKGESRGGESGQASNLALR